MRGLTVGMRDVPCQLAGTTFREGSAEEDWKIVGTKWHTKRNQYK